MSPNHKGKNNSQYIDGRTLKPHYCQDCKKRISYNAKRCKKCADKQHGFEESGQNNPMYGIRRFGSNSPHYKHGKTNKQRNCCDCNKKLGSKAVFYNTKRCRSCAVKYVMKTNKKLKENLSRKAQLRTGTSSSNWRGGVSFVPYSIKFNRQLKRVIRERDNYTCRVCSMTEEDHYRKLDIHHIDYNKKNCREDNLISLCQKCHGTTSGDRDYWYAYFTYLMERE